MARKKKSALGEIPIVKTLNLYSRLLTAWRTKGLLDKPEDNTLGKDEIFYSNNRVYTTRGVKKPYFVHDLPKEINKGIITDLRLNIMDRINGELNRSHGRNDRCTVTFITIGENYKLDMNNASTRGRISYWSRQERRIADNMDFDTTLEEELSSDKHNESTVRMVRSYRLMKQMNEEHAGFFKTKFILELNATSDEALEEGEKGLMDWAFRNGDIKLKPLFFQANEYFMSYSPMGNNKHPRRSMLRKMHMGDVLPDVILNNMSVLTHGGTIGDRIGVPHGVDVMTRSVFAIDVGSGKDAKNFLLTAKTGQGKSVYVKSALGYYDLMGYSTVTLDYEGDEYAYLGSLMGANLVSISGGSTKYVNTLAISNITGDDETDTQLLMDARNMTEKVFNILMQSDAQPSGMDEFQQSVLDDLIDRAYRKVGVVLDDTSTWHRSVDSTYYTLYEELLKLVSSRDSGYNLETVEAMGKMQMVLKRYFEKSGPMNTYFKNPISVNEILTSRHLVFSFGMKGQDEGQMDTKSLALRQLFVSYLTMLKANYNKARGKKTVVVLEELQRYLEQPQSAGVVANFASGGRKRGLVLYLITNSPASLIEGRASAGSTMDTNIKTIVDSISMQIIGGLEQQPMDVLVNTFGLHDARASLEFLVEAASSEGGHPYKNCFFIKYKEQSVIVKAICHPELIKLPIFDTTIIQKTDEEEGDIELMYGVKQNNDLINDIAPVEEGDLEYLEDGQAYEREINRR